MLSVMELINYLLLNICKWIRFPQISIFILYLPYPIGDFIFPAGDFKK